MGVIYEPDPGPNLVALALESYLPITTKPQEPGLSIVSPPRRFVPIVIVLKPATKGAGRDQ